MTLHIIKGKAQVPRRGVIVGPPGVGKSTFACSEPGVLALDYEDGLDHIGVDRVKGASTWLASLALIREVCTGPGDHTGVVLDTVDRLEAQAATHICQVEGVDGKKKRSLADYGYNDGYKALAQVWRELLFALEGARAKGRSVMLVAHCQRSKVNDPMLGEYSEWIAAIHKDCWSTTHQWADAVLFATYDGGVVDGRSILSGERVLFTKATTGFKAKHRPNIASPIPLSWEAYSQAVAAVNRSAEDVIASIRKLATEETKALAEVHIDKAGSDVLRLVAVESALKKKLAPVVGA